MHFENLISMLVSLSELKLVFLYLKDQKRKPQKFNELFWFKGDSSKGDGGSHF